MRRQDDFEPMIARDTHKPLVILGGYEIAKGGGIRRKHIDLSVDGRSPATDDDLAMLKKHGVQWLREQQMWGILDRLQYSGHISCALAQP